jgi:hypothetical protein
MKISIRLRAIIALAAASAAFAQGCRNHPIE